jgi:hypothetical protein
MFWALARVSFRAAKIVSCNKKKNFMVFDQNYHNCSTLVVATTTKPNLSHLASALEVAERHTIPF